MLLTFKNLKFLPEELLEMILKKSVVGIMIYKWMTNVSDFESESRSYALLNEVSIKTWRTANSCVKSVMYQWMHTKNLKREAALKKREQFFISFIISSTSSNTHNKVIVINIDKNCCW